LDADAFAGWTKAEAGPGVGCETNGLGFMERDDTGLDFPLGGPLSPVWIGPGLLLMLPAAPPDAGREGESRNVGVGVGWRDESRDVGFDFWDLAASSWLVRFGEDLSPRPILSNKSVSEVASQSSWTRMLLFFLGADMADGKGDDCEFRTEEFSMMESSWD
jgi:hypothetical protein